MAFQFSVVGSNAWYMKRNGCLHLKWAADPQIDVFPAKKDHVQGLRIDILRYIPLS